MGVGIERRRAVRFHLASFACASLQVRRAAHAFHIGGCSDHSPAWASLAGRFAELRLRCSMKMASARTISMPHHSRCAWVPLRHQSGQASHMLVRSGHHRLSRSCVCMRPGESNMSPRDMHLHLHAGPGVLTRLRQHHARVNRRCGSCQRRWGCSSGPLQQHCCFMRFKVSRP